MKNSQNNDKSGMHRELNELRKRIPQCLLKDRHRLARKLSGLRSRWKKGQDVTLPVLDLSEQVDQSIAKRIWRINNVPEVVYPANLPVMQKKEEILQAVQKHPVVIIAGETGSGKTSQIPKICLEAGRGREGKIGCTQPRRVAATSIAQYIAGQVQGEGVAYQIRFHSTDSPHSYIKLMTDGVLLAELQSDKFLNEYDTLIIDEAHERTLNIDFILGYLKKILTRRSDLRVIVSSATIDTESFSRFFDNAPVIEVSGRTYPVLVEYQPLDRRLEELGECTIIDMAVSSAREIIEIDAQGDILIFMPTEADIRETVEKLRGGLFQKVLVLPLFGRLAMQDQNRIFQKSSRQKIVVATNIAETSLTIPGIRYVIDTGFARISRYCMRTQTKRLPIEPISRSSAEQRKGRCGRMEDGICLRLYSEEDFDTRNRFTPPEIKRSELAEVILRMSYLSLGDISTFPFIDPPSKIAIRTGFSTLRELGAIDSNRELTRLGRRMAQLPTDPRTARILLAGQKRGALREILIIAAALSIQDPRERPYEKQKQADEKHAQFAHKESDFLSYLRLWESYHDTWKEFKTQNKMRKFCRRNFLSYSRMREWHDLHWELSRCMRDLHKRTSSSKAAGYEHIHQAILSGYLGNICRKTEKKLYQARNNQEMVIFPGSGLHKRQPDWVVAAEMVETSRLFARTVAQIDVSWIEPLAGDLCRHSYHEPRWDRKSGQVIAYEKVTLWGMTIVERRRVHYGKINRKEAREIFICDGLVPGELDVEFSFLQKNLALIASVIAMENRIRRRTLLVEDWQLADFYRECLPDVVNVVELREYIKKRGDSGLCMDISHVSRGDVGKVCCQSYPDHLWLGSQKLEIEYCFDPEDPGDGITLKVPMDTLAQLAPGPFEWLVPGWLPEKIAILLKSLPKSLRKQLVPIGDKANSIAVGLPRQHCSLMEALRDYLKEHYRIKIDLQDFNADILPKHMFMRFAIMDKRGKIVTASRNLSSLQEELVTDDVNVLWQKAQREWFLPGLRNWCFDSLPESVEISPAKGGIPHLGYPGLEIQRGKINRTLFPSLREAEQNSREALALLLEFSLAEELARLKRALVLPKEMVAAWQKRGWACSLERESFACLKNSLLCTSEIIRKRCDFVRKREDIQKRLLDIIPHWLELLSEILDCYLEIEKQLKKEVFRNAKNNLKQTLGEARKSIGDLLTDGVLKNTPLDKLNHYPRYLRGISMRLSRAAVDPMRDRKRQKEIEPYLDKLEDANLCIEKNDFLGRQLIGEYQWLLEEWKISLFAQELKTACPVSAKRLDKKWDEIVERMRYQKPTM